MNGCDSGSEKLPDQSWLRAREEEARIQAAAMLRDGAAVGGASYGAAGCQSEQASTGNTPTQQGSPVQMLRARVHQRRRAEERGGHDLLTRAKRLEDFLDRTTDEELSLLFALKRAFDSGAWELL